MSDDICGVTCGDGTPCQNPAGENGFCWLPSHNPDIDEDDGRGRPEKLTHERQEAIAADLEAGIPVKHAAPMNGIRKQTFYNWIERGEEQDEGVYADFFDRVTRAREQGKGGILRKAIDASEGKLENAEPRTLLKIYKEIEYGGDAHKDDAEEHSHDEIELSEAQEERMRQILLNRE